MADIRETGCLSAVWSLGLTFPIVLEFGFPPLPPFPFSIAAFLILACAALLLQIGCLP